ncbi:MAG: ATP-dependent 6-phosphofructokinase [Myxococcales bacterium]|nr:ATP-dependent 6-phosphofructokinase [Myxococcales bacterium]
MTPTIPPPPRAWSVTSLGPRAVRSPLGLSTVPDDEVPDYTEDGVRISFEIEHRLSEAEEDRTPSFEKAGPREKIFFEPERTRAGIVTCGGLCPGINNVVRSIVLQLVHKYGVREVLGFRYGYEGLDPDRMVQPDVLTPDAVRHIHHRGGTILGSSRGKRDAGAMVDVLEKHGVDILFAIGGDGTMRGAHAIHEEISRRGKSIAVVGVPKTIDNDVPYVDRSFGFETAVEMARMAIDAAHTEALSLRNGIGLVKLMGRDAGFIAASASLASHDVNVCLVPEVSFQLEGERGLLRYLERRLEARAHAVIVVAEGCGKQRGVDIGPWLKEHIESHFVEAGVSITLKYIDPSYMVRSGPANASDAVFCDALARHAVHAAMAGKTDIVIGRWHRAFTHVPLPLLMSAGSKEIDPDKQLWLSVIEATGQPHFGTVHARAKRKSAEPPPRKSGRD